MPRPARRHDDPTEGAAHIDGHEGVPGDRQATEGQLVAETRFGIMFVRPFEKAVVDIVPRHKAARMGRGEDDPRPPQARHLIVALKEVVPKDDMPRSAKDREMGKAHDAVVAQLGIVRVHVQGDGRAGLGGNVQFVRLELAAIHHQTLTAGPYGGDPPVKRPVEDAIVHPQRKADLGQHQTACDAQTVELDLAELDAAEVLERGQVDQIAIPTEGEAARPRRRKQRLAKFQRPRRDIDRPDIDLAPHAGADDLRAHRDIGDIGDAGQAAWLRDRIGCDGCDIGRGPSGACGGLDLAVADDPPLVKAGKSRDRAKVDGCGQAHAAARHVEFHMVGKEE